MSKEIAVTVKRQCCEDDDIIQGRDNVGPEKWYCRYCGQGFRDVPGTGFVKIEEPVTPTDPAWVKREEWVAAAERAHYGFSARESTYIEMDRADAFRRLIDLVLAAMPKPEPAPPKATVDRKALAQAIYTAWQTTNYRDGSPNGCEPIPLSFYDDNHDWLAAADAAIAMIGVSAPADSGRIAELERQLQAAKQDAERWQRNYESVSKQLDAMMAKRTKILEVLESHIPF